jgi:hypothetical protein
MGWICGSHTLPIPLLKTKAQRELVRVLGWLGIRVPSAM